MPFAKIQRDSLRLMVERSMKNKQVIGYKILPQLPPLFFSGKLL